jgi:hypothetical protein
MNEPELKPCPFCGGAAEFRECRYANTNEPSAYIVFCDACEIQFRENCSCFAYDVAATPEETEANIVRERAKKIVDARETVICMWNHRAADSNSELPTTEERNERQ